MYCQSCGVQLTQQMKFCNRCGVLLIQSDETADIKRTEKRLDSHLESLFWVTVFGLAPGHSSLFSISESDDQ